MNLIDADSQNFVSPPFFIRSQVTVFATGLGPTDRVEFDMLVLSNPLMDDCACPPLVVQPLSIEATEPLTCCNGPIHITATRPFAILEGPQGVLVRARLVTSDPGVTVQHVWMEETSTSNVTDFMRGCPSACCDDPENWQPTGHFMCFESDLGLGQHRQMQNPCGLIHWELVLPESDENYYTPTGAQRCQLTSCEGIDVVEEDEVQQQVADPCGNLSWQFLCPVVWDATGNIACIPFGDGDGYHIRREYRNQCGETRWVQDAADGTWQQTGQVHCEGDELFVQLTNACGVMRWESQGASSVTWVATGTTRCTATDYEQQEVNQCGHLRWTVIEPLSWTATGATRCTSTSYEQQEANQCGQTRWVFVAPLAWTATGDYDCVDNRRMQKQTNQCGGIRWIDTGDACDVLDVYDVLATPVSPEVLEGQNACWNLTTNRPVTGVDLLVTLDLSGADQVRHAYATPRTATIPVGQSSTMVCVTTTSDSGAYGDEDLCITVRTDTRIVSGNTSCISVLADTSGGGGGDSTHTILSIVPVENPITEGEYARWTVTLNTVVAGSPLVINFTLSGDDYVRHGYAHPSVTIPVGQSSKVVKVKTIDDSAVDGTEDLCITANTSARVTSVPAVSCIDVEDNDYVSELSDSYAQSFDCHVKVSSHNAAAGQRIAFLPDGTWVVKNGVVGNIPVTSGLWHTGTPTGSDWEIRCTGTETYSSIYGDKPGQTCTSTDTSGSTPYDSGWVSMDTSPSFFTSIGATATYACTNDADSSLNFSISIRNKANHSDTITGAGSICASASAG